VKLIALQLFIEIWLWAECYHKYYDKGTASYNILGRCLCLHDFCVFIL